MWYKLHGYTTPTPSQRINMIPSILYSGKFSLVQISRKCCIHFRRNFCSFYFCVSTMRQLTMPLSVTILFWVFTSMKNDLVANFPQARQGISSLRTVAQLWHGHSTLMSRHISLDVWNINLDWTDECSTLVVKAMVISTFCCTSMQCSW